MRIPPESNEEPVLPEAERARQEFSVCQRRVLVADDDEAMRLELLRILAEDYDLVGMVADGRQLVEMEPALKPDAVIVDISMPRMNGFEAVRLMKLAGAGSKIVFFTTNGSRAYVRKAFELGADGYVLKALGNEDLTAALQAVLNGGTFVSPRIGFDLGSFSRS